MPSVRRNLLLVEDDVQLRLLLTTILTQSGYRVRTAEDGFTALAEMRADRPDLILSDLYMLGMSGFELLSVVRRRFPGIPVIAMSSAFTDGDIPTGVAADAFYQKATSVLTLLRMVETTDAPQPSRHSAHNGDSAPIWIATNALDAEARVVIACPECLRTSTYAPTPAARSITVIRSADCAYCLTVIRYAMVQMVDPGPPKALWRPTNLSASSQVSAA
jgi:CheY-like chemotaxis protein